MTAEKPTPRPSKRYGRKLLLGSASAVALIAVFEGDKSRDGSPVAYADMLAGGLPTVCAGLTRHVTKTPIIVGERWSAEKCAREEAHALAAMQARLEQCFVAMPPQSVFDAASSHAWNNGVAATCGSAAMAEWRRSNWATGCRRMAFAPSGKRVWAYVKTGKTLPNGKPEYRFVPGLARRRDAEYRLCVKGIENADRQ